MWWHPVRSMPLAKAAGSDSSIWPTTCLMEWHPTSVSINLTKGWQMFPIPSMETIRKRIFSFLKGPPGRTWWKEIKSSTILVRWRSYSSNLSYTPMTAGSTRSRQVNPAYGRWITRLLKICLKCLNAIPRSCHTPRIRRDHWWRNWAPSPSSWTATIRSKIYNVVLIIETILTKELKSSSLNLEGQFHPALRETCQIWNSKSKKHRQFYKWQV